MSPLFSDTSSLVKWYVSEANSDAVEALFQGYTSIVISRLASVELRSTLARRRSSGHLPASLELEILDLFHDHQRQGHLVVMPLKDSHCVQAERLMQTLSDLPLRSLDAIQLASASDSGLPEFATADRIQAAAARAMGLTVHDFSLQP